jgi:membrane-associated phospholipid phosphatase
MPILEFIKKVDRELFEFINRDFTSHFLDGIMIILRNPLTWIPLYVFLTWWGIVKLKKQVLFFIVFSVVTVSLTDSITAFVLKPFFERLRPCYEPALAGIVRILDGCGGKYSFPSNHAANHFGLATFWFLSIYKMIGKRWYWLWFWAFLVCYAQIYVGKHYPGDILGGAIFGTFTGMLIYLVYDRVTRSSRKFPPFMMNTKSQLHAEIPARPNDYEIIT